MHPQAGVDPETEGDVVAIRPEDVEPVRVGVPPAIPVGVAQQEDDVGALGYRDTADAGVGGRPPQDHRHRRLPSDHLVEGGRDERTVGSYRRQLVRVGQQGEQQRAECPVRRLRAGRQQEQEEREDLLVGQALPGQLADEVVLRSPSADGEYLAEVPPQRDRRGDRPVPVGDDTNQLGGPVPELRIVRCGQAQDASDDLYREVEGQLFDQCRPAASHEAVDELLDHRSDRRLVQRRRAERRRHQRPLPPMLRLVHLQDRPAHDGTGDTLVDRGRERLAVPQNLDAFVQPGHRDHPAVGPHPCHIGMVHQTFVWDHRLCRFSDELRRRSAVGTAPARRRGRRPGKMVSWRPRNGSTS